MDALVPREWTREEMHRAAQAGVFRSDERLELIDGQLLTKMSPRGNPHVICVLLLEDWLREVVGAGRHVRTQMPLALGSRDEPEPDVMVVAGKPRDYDELPTSAQIVLIVEVGDSTLSRDRRLKIPRYAMAGIREIWLVDLENRRLEVYREPEANGYGVVTILTEDREIEPLFQPGARISISELLPGQRS